MNRRDIVWIGLGALLAVACIALVLTPGASATNDPGSGGGNVYGDWTVTDTRTYTGVSINLWNGNLVIRSGASLTLDSTTLTFCPTTDGRYGIDVNARGTLVIRNGATITSWDTNYHYYFKVSGSMTIDSSYIYEVWGDTASWKGGIQLFSSSVTISDSEIAYGRTGGISIFDCSPEITGNYIHANGADGKSTYYVYGIYGTNTHGNITGNDISENDYSLTCQTSSGYMWPDEYWYDEYWNGHYWYYYWWSGYYYRYEDLQVADTSTHYGKGVYLEGGSTTNLADNTIEKNGWGVFEQSWEYGSYWEDSYHYVDSYKNIYKIPSCSGVGVYSGNSSLTISNNKIDRNGYEPSSQTYTDWYNYPYTTYYSVVSGVAVQLVGSFGDIKNNSISNGAVLIDCYRSSPNITGNSMLSDYGVDPNNQWVGNAAFIPGKVGYTIRNFECTPYIANNTIKAVSQDYAWYDYATGRQFYSIDYYYVIDNYKCPNMKIENNKITFETRNYGHVVATGINATLKSTKMAVTGNTIEYKFTSQWATGTITTIPMKLVQAALLSDVHIENNIFKGPGGSGGNPSPRAVGVLGAYGSTVTLVNNKFTGLDTLVVRDFSTASVSKLTATGIPNTGVQALSGASVEVRGSSLTGNGRGMEVVKSKVEVYDSTLSNPQEFLLDKAATVNLYNTKHTKGAAQLLDMDSFFNVSWSVTLTVVWQNDLPVDGADVSIRDMLSDTVYTGTTDGTGMPDEYIWVKEYSGHNQVVSRLTPHRIYVTKARVSAMDLFLVDGPLSITFRLVDTIPPELNIIAPYEGQHFNTATVRLHGTASDPESGILDGVVRIYLDTGGAVPVEVRDGGWSFEKRLSDGLHIVRIIVSDQTGNQVRTTLSFTIDTSGPVLQIFTPLEGSSTNKRTITVTGVTEVGALVTVNGLPAPLDKRFFSKPLSLENGPNEILVTASDAAGNTRTVLVHVTLDTQVPVLNVREPVEGASVNENPVTVAGTTEPGCAVRVNGVPVPLVDTGYETLVDLSEGVNAITVTSTDPAGNVNTRSFNIYLDTVMPDLNLFTPRNNLWTYQSRVLVSGATEQGTTVTVNGQNANVQNTLFSSFVQLIEGPNQITVSARDAAGNRLTLTRTVILDTRMPDLVVSSPADGSSLATRVVPVVGSADWGTSVFVNGEQVPVVDFVFSTTVMAVEDGPFTVEVVARDQAGNTAIITRRVHLDTVSPVVTITFPLDGARVKQRVVTVNGQTEPFSTVVINTETMITVGRDGLFSMPVALEYGENRITVTATDDSGNTGTSAVVAYKPSPAKEVKEDLTWALNLTGLLIGIGIGLPVATWMLTASWSRRRQGVLSELEAAEEARREGEAEKARRAALPTVERMDLKRKPRPEVEQKAPAEPAPLAEPPKAEAAAPEAAKTGLKDKSGATEVSPDEIDQETKMKAKSEPEAPAPAKPESPEASLKDKGGEAEGEAGETDLPGGMGRK